MSELSIRPPTTAAPSFFGLSRDRLRQRLEGLGLAAYRAEQMYSWVYQRHVRDPLAMTDLPVAFRRRLGTVLDFAPPEVHSVHASPDGNTHKFVLRLADGSRVESVSMRTPKRLTFCISSQVGCALKCAFCATGLMGLQRNLTAAEIIAQVLAMGDFHQWGRARTPAEALQDHDVQEQGGPDRFNIVYMGMGEPLANLAPVTESLRILHDPRGLNLGARRVTVSTSGLVPQIRELARLDLQVGLAVSLHATTDRMRDELVPVNKRWPIRALLDAAGEYGRTVGRRVTLEYVLLGGVNDTMGDADRLAAFARELPSKVNLIPYNPVPGLPWSRPDRAAIDEFVNRLLPHAPAVTVRHTQGGDI